MRVITEYEVDVKGLTDKEAEIMKLFCKIGSDQELADKHGISVNTLRQYKKTILEKKNIGRIEQLIQEKIKNY